MTMTDAEDRRRIAMSLIAIVLFAIVVFLAGYTGLRLADGVDWPSSLGETRATPAASVGPHAAGVRDLVPARRA